MLLSFQRAAALGARGVQQYSCGRSARSPTVTLFTGAGCTLCDVAKEVLSAVADAAPPFELELVDINTELGHHAKYKWDVRR